MNADGHATGTTGAERTSEPTAARRRVVMALAFFPRGGSAQVARYLARGLGPVGWDTTIVCGSLGRAGEPSHAASFYAGLDVHAVDFTAAALAPDPLAADPPFQPSFEDRPGAPDRVYASVDDATFERLVALWAEALDAAGAARADLLHLHHLTPIHEAALRHFPHVPRVGHIHGTELAMLDRIRAGAPAGWRYADRWAERMRRWAQSCDRLLVLSPEAVARVPAELGVDPDRVVWAPNGFDPQAFDRRPASPPERRALWQRWLVEEPRGWDESGRPGTVAYRPEDLECFAGAAVTFVFVGRFTAMKRVPLLVRAHARALRALDVPAPLVIVGGFPGEWEGEHPLAAIRATGNRYAFLAGWHGHDELPQALNAADVFVLPSVREEFGAVIVEAMACGLPAIVVNAYGPAEIVADGETGWLVPPDDEQALARALVEAASDSEERRARGERAYAEARRRYGWPALARGLAAVYDDVVAGRPPREGSHTLVASDHPGR